MMDVNEYIDAFINEEKEITPSPLLQSRIVAKIHAEHTPRIASFWQSLAVAASLAAITIPGFLLGNSYQHLSKGDNYLVINDKQIENLLILINHVD